MVHQRSPGIGAPAAGEQEGTSPRSVSNQVNGNQIVYGNFYYGGPPPIPQDEDGFSEVTYKRRERSRRQAASQLIQPTPTQPFEDQSSRRNYQRARSRSPWQRPTSPIPPVTPSGQAPRGSSTFRVSNFEITVSEHDIRPILQGLLPDTSIVRMHSLAPAAVDRQTVVATSRQRLQLQAARAKLKRSKPPGQLDPIIDDKFQGMTPVKSLVQPKGFARRFREQVESGLAD